MISLRQHAVSVVAVFLALAIGIALATGPLAGDGAARSAGSRAGPGPAETETEPDIAAYADEFADVAAERLYAGGLRGHAVAVLALPGAEPATIEAFDTQIEAAGGAITGTYTMADGAADPAGEATVDAVTAGLVDSLSDPRLDTRSPTYRRLGQLLALAMATQESSSVRADATAAAIRVELQDSGLVEPPEFVRNAPLILVVLPPGESGVEDDAGSRLILGDLVQGLSSRATGVVVTGDTASAQSGELAAVRHVSLDGPVATVDGLETRIGRVSTILALISVVSGTGGSYGAAGSDGAVGLQ